ncbi:hypothetical protein [Gemmatimonas sp.]|uniref:hypothetical protein n=1 Tax=Gemmatimonas sp. TaxID=1962908 RepID=UPI00286E39D8|nr:hypothetical protein [Gemmatimonas sp.]
MTLPSGIRGWLLARACGLLTGSCTLVLAGASAAAPRLFAQSMRPGPDGVTLIVRPRVGDMLRLQMDQTIEMSGRRTESSVPPVGSGAGIDGRRAGGTVPPASKSPEYGPRRARASLRVTKLVMYAHSLVEASDLSSTTLLATTDSMAMWAGTAAEQARLEMLPLPADGRQVRVRVTPDGAMRVSDPPPGAMELGATLASMPALLPENAVRVGERWVRDIVLPSLPLSGYRTDGVVRTRFRLDSLTQGGRNAWISMEGELRRDGAARELPAGTRVVTAGTVRGTMVLDRLRAWIVDARTVIDVQSEVTPGPAEAARPMLLDLRIVQRIRIR